MSRIEKALEKAMKEREGGTAPKREEAAVPAARVPEVREAQDFSIGQQVHVDNPYLITAKDPDSPVSEEYRKLKSLIVKLTKMGDFLNTLMVTSTVGGEGKTLTALNFAITLAQEFDHTVLLVDADLRRPAVHHYLGIPQGLGLTDCLTRGVDVGDALIQTGIGKLAILTSGSHVPNPVEVTASGRMRDLVKELKHRYADRYVIFDTPPVLPFAEAHAIGSMVDGVLFVVGEGRASASSIKEALSMLKETRVLGMVYNNASVNLLDSTYYYYRANYKEQAER